MDELKSRNLRTATLDFSERREIPKDAALVVIPAPKTKILPREQELLKSFLRKDSGRVLILLEPDADHGLDDLLFEWGLLTVKALAVDTSRNSLFDGGDLMVRRFAPHPITDKLLKLNMSIITDRARVVREDPGRPIDESLIIKELMATSDDSWGEKNYAVEGFPQYDPAVDLKVPSESQRSQRKKVDSSLGISIPGGRLIVIGTSSFIANNRIKLLEISFLPSTRSTMPSTESRSSTFLQGRYKK